ncbi:hypothetical protein DCAR_0625008 [Daucus carota subsp. sativus]|uniref:Uncharacterized protein n=1 Tax=Daucus carota subsp. sativus TaxID=79200 RepID=A0AAF0XF05_DAUCS|nr:hypothetical protein DCAR_0625008 [Daucus carota subsp. sativus]
MVTQRHGSGPFKLSLKIVHAVFETDLNTDICSISLTFFFEQFVRPLYRNPVHGALIGSTVLGNSFSLANIRTSHSQAGVTLGSGGVSAKLRPLSPHLTVYKPQSTSTSSIFHRIAYIYMGVAALFYYLLYLKMGMICFTYEKFYQFFYYASGLFPIINELSVVALAYYVFKGAAQYIKFR